MEQRAAGAQLVALAVHLHLLGTAGLERRQQRRRIEDVAPRALGPLALHQSHHLHVVELPEPRRGHVDDLQARRAGARGKGLRAEPAADGGREIEHGTHGAGVVAAVRVGEPRERAHHGGADAFASIGLGGGGARRAVVVGEKRHEAAQLIDEGAGVGQRLQARGRVDGGLQRGQRGAAVARFAAGVGIGTGPRGRERAQPVESAQVAHLGQRAAGGGHRRRRHLRAVGLEAEVRRAEQGGERGPREALRHAVEHQVERGGVGLGGQRQGIEGLEGHARAAEHVAGQVEVGQRTRHHQRRAAEGGAAVRAPVGLQAPRHAFEFCLAVAVAEHARGGSAARLRLRHHQCRYGLRRFPLPFLDPHKRQPPPIQQPRRQHGFGGHDVDLIEAADGGEQRHVGGPQALGIGEPVAHRDDHPAHRLGRGRRQEALPQAVLVHAAAVGQARFVAPKRRGEKPRLIEQLQRAPIRFGGGLELRVQQALEVVQGAVLAAHVIVEREHLGQQCRAQVKRRRDAGVLGVARGGAQQHLALEGRQHARRIGQPIREPRVEIGARADGRQQAHGGGLVQQAVFEGAPQLLAGGPGGHQDERVGDGGQVDSAHRPDQVFAEAGKVVRPQQAGAAWRDHRRAGRPIWAS